MSKRPTPVRFWRRLPLRALVPWRCVPRWRMSLLPPKEMSSYLLSRWWWRPYKQWGLIQCLHFFLLLQLLGEVTTIWWVMGHFFMSLRGVWLHEWSPGRNSKVPKRCIFQSAAEGPFCCTQYLREVQKFAHRFTTLRQDFDTTGQVIWTSI